MKILIIDDEKEIVNLLVKFLMKKGYRKVIGESSPERALQIIKEGSFDLIISDLVMEPYDGFVMLKEAIKKDINFIMMTAHGTIESAVVAMKQGASDYIVKPFSLEELFIRIKRIEKAVIPSTLLESELFGYKKGAFTGAERDKSGLFEIANKGTLFLDEIGNIPKDAQAKLLKVIEEGSFYKLGDRKPTRVDVRIIAATNTDLKKAIKDGSFREDLYFRISVFPIEVPPLRERKDDRKGFKKDRG